ncbi:MAG: adenosyl-hopene transferase HpnH [Phycisphaerales bacterium]|nr:adenosyl-hopene transferase HpnH [Phycisphaerae bacterium]NNF42774.1 adenosyl-hopene transferase HpnH [Phycisphaerales bacterium]NNM26107.1 adenosyl-hopene transferase HpnH [Phycisphaerales bacterium]
MAVPVSQMWTVASYVVRQKLRRRHRYPLVLMLEPLFRCNLACAGCGKIQYPAHVLKRDLPLADCLRAVDECGAPMVSIPGGEPLMYPDIGPLVEALVARRKYVYLCTNAILLREKIEAGVFTPSKYLTFSIHMDGLEEAHDFAVCREGIYEQAADAIRFAVERGYRVTTNTTLFEGADPNAVRAFFDTMMELGVEGMMVSPGYAYEKAPDQRNFLRRQETNELFEMILANRKRRWRFNQSPLFLEYLMGRREYECTPWGNPTYNMFGWQKPCYLLQEGYVDTFQELIDDTDWSSYGRASGNPKCQQCMVHCGYEPTAVHHTFSSFGGMWGTVKAMLFNRYASPRARANLEEAKQRPLGPAAHLVQLGFDVDGAGPRDQAGAA